jgi:hypothetical protein
MMTMKKMMKKRKKRKHCLHQHLIRTMQGMLRVGLLSVSGSLAEHLYCAATASERPRTTIATKMMMMRKQTVPKAATKIRTTLPVMISMFSACETKRRLVREARDHEAPRKPRADVPLYAAAGGKAVPIALLQAEDRPLLELEGMEPGGPVELEERQRAWPNGEKMTSGRLTTMKRLPLLHQGLPASRKCSSPFLARTPSALRTARHAAHVTALATAL